MIRKIIKRRRRTALRTLIVSFAVATALCAAFAFGFRYYRIRIMENRCLEALDYTESSVRSLLAPERNPQYKFSPVDLRCILTRYAQFRIRLPLFDEKNSEPSLTNDEDGCHAFAFAWDKDGNPVVLSRCTLQAYFKFGDDASEGGNFICEESDTIPGLKRLFDDYRELMGRTPGKDSVYYTELTMESAYINREESTFVPGRGTMYLKDMDAVTNDPFEAATADTVPFDITVTDESYEYVEFDPNGYPRVYILFNFFGEDPELTEKVYREDIPEDGQYYLTGGSRVSTEGGIIRARRVFYFYFDQEQYCVCLYNIVDCNTAEVVKYDRKIVIPICLAVYLLTALICWRRIVMDKAKYAMEDYQRDLTNHLAHDIKTPLMAIGGYAENIKEVDLTKEETDRYLDAILANVGFTDSIINRTLYLNTMEERGIGKAEMIAVDPIAAESLKKYEPMLEQKGITYCVEGSATIKADRITLESIVENLISNAVKYTPESGVIRVDMDDRRLAVTNTVKGKVDVGSLTTPFVRGEEARSNPDGTGLGLSIAEHAAALNGFSLKLSSTEEEFRAELKFR
ncbi:MAG: HAMP domain-containing histidine kinase [Lachnospiraceae bacterium]|nr:HAMP domain-containing histidine kinase [Lachnospiraceae bacterium]